MIPKLFSDKFKAKFDEMEKQGLISVAEMLGLKKSKLVFYPFITSKGFQDIRTVFKQTKEEDDFLIQKFKQFIVGDKNLMEKAVSIARAVNNHMIYNSDKSIYNEAEYWNNPIGSYNKRTDDCDSYAVLICYLLRLFGAKEYEVFVRAGDVYYKDGKYAGGHANAIVLDEETYLFYPVEGSFYPADSLREFGTKPLMTHSRYSNTWWVTNDAVSYSTMPWLKFIK